MWQARFLHSKCVCYLYFPFIPQRSHFTQEDMKCLSQYSDNDDFQGVDMLLSSEWPQGVTNHAISPVSVVYHMIIR